MIYLVTECPDIPQHIARWLRCTALEHVTALIGKSPHGTPWIIDISSEKSQMHVMKPEQESGWFQRCALRQELWKWVHEHRTFRIQDTGTGLTLGMETFACRPLIFTLSGLTVRSVWPWGRFMQPGAGPSVLDSLCSCLAVWLCADWDDLFIGFT